MAKQNKSGKVKQYDFFQPRWLWISGGALSGVITIGIMIYLLVSPDSVVNNIASSERPVYWILYALFYTVICAGIPLILPLICSLIRLAADKAVDKELDMIAAGSRIGAVYDYGSNSLSVEAKNQEFRNLFKITKHEVKAYDYAEPSLVFTSATVGGVTTGGFHTQGGYSNKKGYYLNCELIWLPRKKPVEYIELSASLLKAAHSSNISKYLDGNKIRVVEEEKQAKESITAAQIGMPGLALSLREREKAECYPTQSKCEEIIEWLSKA